MVPTLAAGEALADCLRSLKHQTYRDFEVIVVDNSLARLAEGSEARIIFNQWNVGFGAAINQGAAESESEYVVALNDDAVADAEWLTRMVECADGHPRDGMFASEVWMQDSGQLDSAGMLIARDGSSKQRGHGEAAEAYRQAEEALFPSGSAALYRRKMLREIGGFDESFFLYCEDTDLGLRARWAGWGCRYVPGAIVHHKYSHSAGRASPMKAYFVERNRIYTVIKNFPLSWLIGVRVAAAVRYFWHFISMLEGRGKAAEFRESGHSVFWLYALILRAHVVALFRVGRLWKARRAIFATRKVTSAEFTALLNRHRISLRRVAQL